MRVIIIGGDVSAFVCAITCRRDNLDVIVLESGQDTEVPRNSHLELRPTTNH